MSPTLPSRRLILALIALAFAGGAACSDGGDTSGPGDGGSGDAVDGGGTELPEGRCRVDDDCGPGPTNGEPTYCRSPGEPLPSGICREATDCETDADCAGKGQVCDSASITGQLCGPNGPLICVPACSSDEDCSGRGRCETDGHCRPTSCKQDSDCRGHETCDGGACANRTCGQDDPCPEGECVGTTCYPELGTCTEPAV